MKATRDDYKAVIFSGCGIDKNGVSLCNLANYNPRIVRANEYQVWSHRHSIFELYKNIDEAVERFMELIK